jgi:alpha-beta hydrolase superfamily lysophospholipase
VRRRRVLLWIGGIVLVLAAAALALDHWLPYMLLSHYKFSVDPRPKILDEYGAATEPIEFVTGDGVPIRGWFIPAPPGRDGRPAATLMVLHTLGRTRQDMLEFTLPFWRDGFSLALIDLRGHGESGGEFFTYGAHEWRDVAGLLDWLARRPDGAGERVAVLGASSGGAVAIAAAARDRRIRAVATIDCFADLRTIAAHQARWLPGFWLRRALAKAERLAEFRVEDASPERLARELRCPLLVAHGTADSYVPFEEGQRLYAAAGSPRKEFYEIQGAGHATMFAKGGDALRARISVLFREAAAEK